MKTITTVTIDPIKKDLAKKSGINISKALDDYLSALLSNKYNNNTINLIKLNEEIEELQELIAEKEAILNGKIQDRTQFLLKQKAEEEEDLEQQTLKMESIKASGYLEDA